MDVIYNCIVVFLYKFRYYFNDIVLYCVLLNFFDMFIEKFCQEIYLIVLSNLLWFFLIELQLSIEYIYNWIGKYFKERVVEFF